MLFRSAIHGGIYRARPEVNAVVHNHSTALIPFGVTGMPLRAIFHMGAVIGSEVPIWDSRPEFGDTNLLVTDHEKGRSLAAALGARRAALMRGHGSVVVGATLPIALGRTIYLDHNARLQAQALQLADDPDEVVYLDDEEVQALSWQAYARSWELWQTQWKPRLAAEAALRPIPPSA